MDNDQQDDGQSNSNSGSESSAEDSVDEIDDDQTSEPLPAGRRQTTALRRALPNDQARAQLLSATRREMYDCLGLFQTHVKSVISLMFGIITAVLAVVGFVIEKSSSPAVVELVLNAAPAILVLIVPFSIVSILVIGRYYKLYVAALFYTARLHDDEGIGQHLWFRDIRSLQAPNASTIDDAKLIRRRAYGWPHSWALYALLIGFIGVVSLILAILLWVQL